MKVPLVPWVNSTNFPGTNILFNFYSYYLFISNFGLGFAIISIKKSGE
jgi:hypothetical protein